MIGALAPYVLWIKAVHVMAVIAWMAALLYLPRLMVYHVAAAAGSVQSETFKVMERRLLRGIANPSMIAVYLTGLTLATVEGAWSDAWLHAKLLGVAALTVAHHFIVRWVKAFRDDRNARSGRFYRVANEVPAVLMAFIVILVVVKPF